MVRVGINGFGRIGRAAARIIAQSPDLELVAVNELDADVANFEYLLKYDSLYGRFQGSVQRLTEGTGLRIDGRDVAFHCSADIAGVPWDRHGVDVVIESSGVDQNAQ